MQPESLMLSGLKVVLESDFGKSLSIPRGQFILRKYF